jgi:hypothetical protein
MNFYLKSIFFSLTLLLFSACGTKGSHTEIKAPANLLSKEQMVKILADLHLLEAAVNLRTAQNQTTSTKDSLSYSDIFKKQGTSRDGFQESFKYYASQPAVLSKLYDEVLIDLTRREAEEERKK